MNSLSLDTGHERVNLTGSSTGRDSAGRENRVKLLTFVGVFAIGGTERQVVNLARGLDISQFEPSLACFDRSGQFLKEIEALAIPIFEYHITSLYHPRTLLEQLRFARMLRRNQVQVVHTYGFYPTVFALPAAKLAGVPVTIASIRDTGELLTPLQKYVQKCVCQAADSILVNAAAVRNWLVSQGYNAENIQVIRNGIALDGFEKQSARAGIRQEYGVLPEVPLVAMLGRINRLKGVEHFLAAAAAVSARLPGARFLIVGDVRAVDAPFKEELQRQINRLGLGDRIWFTGFRTDVPQVLSEVSISVLPSLSEGLSNVLLESMAAGVPVIATKVGGNPEVVEDGVSGLLVPPGNSEALAEAICLLIEKPELARRFGRAGRERVIGQFELDRMVRQTEQHYLKLLDQAAEKHIVRGREVRV